MRTTLDIADDVLQAAKELAAQRKTTAGQVLSELARKGLVSAARQGAASGKSDRLGFRPFPSRGGLVTNELIDRLLYEGHE